MCPICKFAIQCYAVADTLKKQTLTAYKMHLKFAHQLSDDVIDQQIAVVKLIGLDVADNNLENQGTSD